MQRTEEIKREFVKGTLDEIKETHPAFGMIGLSRIQQGGKGANLFGSSVKHGHYISLTIKRAERNKHLNRDWYFGKDELIRINISGTQLGELLSSMNVGDGIPCTIERFNGEGIPAIPDSTTIKEETQEQLKNRLDKTFEQSKQLIKDAEAILKNSTMKKADKEKLLSTLTQINYGVGSNLNYAAKCFDEKIEATVAQAKGEVEAFIEHKIHSAGLEALGGKPIVEIEFKEE